MANMEVGSIPVGTSVSTYGDLAKAFNTFGESLINKSILDKKMATEELRYQAAQERQDRLDKANAEVQKQSMLNMQQEYGARKANLAKEELTNTQLGKLIAKDLQATQGMTITNKQYEDLLNKEVSMGAKEYENALNDLNAIIKNKDFSGSAGMVTEEFLTGTDAAKILAYSDKLKAADKVEKDDKIKYLREQVKDDKDYEQQVGLKKMEHKYRQDEFAQQHKYAMAEKDPKEVKSLTTDELHLKGTVEAVYKEAVAANPELATKYPNPQSYYDNFLTGDEQLEVAARSKKAMKIAEDKVNNTFDNRVVHNPKLLNKNEAMETMDKIIKKFNGKFTDKEIREVVMNHAPIVSVEKSDGVFGMGSHEAGEEINLNSIESKLNEIYSSKQKKSTVKPTKKEVYIDNKITTEEFIPPKVMPTLVAPKLIKPVQGNNTKLTDQLNKAVKKVNFDKNGYILVK